MKGLTDDGLCRQEVITCIGVPFRVFGGTPLGIYAVGPGRRVGMVGRNLAGLGYLVVFYRWVVLRCSAARRGRRGRRGKLGRRGGLGAIVRRGRSREKVDCDACVGAEAERAAAMFLLFAPLVVYALWCDRKGNQNEVYT